MTATGVVRTLSIDCSGTTPVVNSVRRIASDASYCYDYSLSMSLAVPSLDLYVVLASDWNSYHKNALQVFRSDGTLLSETIVDNGGNPLAIYSNPSDPTEVTALVDGAEHIFIFNNIDTDTPAVTTRPMIVNHDSWIMSATNPYLLGPGLIDFPVNWSPDPAVGTVIGYNTSDFSVVDLGGHNFDIWYDGGTANMGNGRLVVVGEGETFADENLSQDPGSRHRMWVVDYRTSTSKVVTLDMFMDDITAYPLNPPYPFSLNAGSNSVAADGGRGLVLHAAALVSDDEHGRENQYTVLAWVVQGPSDDPDHVLDPALPAYSVPSLVDLPVVEEGFYTHTGWYWGSTITPVAVDARHTWTGTAPRLSDADTTTAYGEITVNTTPTDDGLDMVGIKIGPYTTPSGSAMKSLTIDVQTRSTGNTMYYAPVGTVILFVVMNQTDGSGIPQISSLQGDWTTSSFEVKASPDALAKLAAGTLFVGIGNYYSDSTVPFVLQVSQIKVTANLLSAP